MSVAVSSSSLYGRRQVAVAKRTHGSTLPRLPRPRAVKKTESKTSAVSLDLQSQHKIGSTLSTLSAAETHPQDNSPVDTFSRSSLRAGSKDSASASFYRLRMGTPSRLPCASSVMDEKYRESLQRHYRLLMTHIVLTDDVMNLLAEEKILPDTMIKDIQEAETREEKNDCLLRALHLRGNKSYKRFRELMYRTGHYFVADLLWDEGDARGSVEEEDLAKFPGLLGCVPETHRRKLFNFLDAKIREKALVLAWKASPHDRMEALNSKVIDFHQERTFRDTISTQERKIQDMENMLETEAEARRNLKMELSVQYQQMQVMKKEHRNALDAQTRFHDANLSTITRLKDRLNKCKEVVRELNEAVKRRLEMGASDSDDGGQGDQEEVEDDVKIAKLERHVRKLLLELKRERERANKGDAQRLEVLSLLNRRYSKEPLVAVIKDVLKHEQKHRSLVMRDILRLADALKHLGPASTPNNPQPHQAPLGTFSLPDAAAAAAANPRSSGGLPDPSILDTKHFKSQLALLRAEAEHIQKRLTWKDTEIAQQREEIHSLKKRIGEEGSPSPTRSMSHISMISSCSQQSPEQPFTTPVDPALLRDVEVSSHSDKSTTPSHNSRVSSASSATKRKSSAGQDKSRRSPKVVTFEKGAARKSRVRSWAGVVRDKLKTDPDKTMVDVEKYLLEEVAAPKAAAANNDFFRMRVPLKPPPSRGEGDIDSVQRKGNSGIPNPARTKKKGVHKYND